MTKLLLTTVSIVALTVSARAADLASRKAAPVAPVPAFTWEGFYAGGSIGALHGRTKADELYYYGTSNGYPMTNARGTGLLVAANIGYNHQFDKWVAGVEADIAYSAARVDGSQYAASEYNYVHVRYPGLASVRARFGYAFNDVLAYATGGVALARIHSIGDHQYLPGGTLTDGIASRYRLRVGYALGAGVEYALSQKVSLKTEAITRIFGSEMTGTATNSCRYGFKKNSATSLTAGLNYHF